MQSLHNIDDGIRSFNRNASSFHQALMLEYSARLLEALEYYVILRYLGEKLNFFGAILILSMASLVGNLVFIIPMQAGSREGGMLIALGWLGIDSSAGIRAGLLYRFRDLLCILIGLIFILVDRRSQSSDRIR